VDLHPPAGGQRFLGGREHFDDARAEMHVARMAGPRLLNLSDQRIDCCPVRFDQAFCIE
jgi:hypothetical protein